MKLVYDYSKVEKLGGIYIDKKDQIINLKKLGFKIEDKKHKLNVFIPTWRHDINEEVDIVEEQLRINGYDKLKEIYSFVSNFDNCNKSSMIWFNRSV